VAFERRSKKRVAESSNSGERSSRAIGDAAGSIRPANICRATVPSASPCER
jgi:hypothetical protein